jgi:polyisoprenoid-binding protein YceI
MSSRLLLSITLCIIAYGAGAAVRGDVPITMNLAQVKSAVTFEAVASPGSLKIRGELLKDSKDPITGSFVLKGKVLSGKAKLHLEALDTGIGMRTKHMKEKYLEVPKFPDADLTLNDVILSDSSSDKTPFTGTLVFHGQTKPIKGTLVSNRKDGVLDLDFQFQVSLGNFGIEQPSFMGIKVADIVDVHAGVQAPLRVND